MKREKYIDIAKGIAAILVIVGHCEFTNETILTWIYSFHMPLFFMINGFFIKNSIKNLSFKDYTKKKVKTILVPYLILSIPLYITYILKAKKYNKLYIGNAIKKFLGIFLVYRDTILDIGMWFLVTLFISDILVYIILKSIFNSKKIKEKNKNLVITTITLIIFTIGVIITTYVKKKVLIWNLDIAPVCTSFILMGYILSVINEKKDILSNKFLCILMFLINIIFTYLNYKICGHSDIFHSNLGNGFYYLLGAVSGSIFILQISKFIGKNKILETIGKHSMIFFALQITMALPIARRITIITSYVFNFDNSFVLCIMITIICSIVLELFSRILEKLMPRIFCKDYSDITHGEKYGKNIRRKKPSYISNNTDI